MTRTTQILFLAGDVMTGRGVDQILSHPADPTLHERSMKDARNYVALAEKQNGKFNRPVDDRYPWGFALAALDNLAPAARVVNLETAVTNSDDYWTGKGIHYRMSPQNVGCLKAAQIDCCSLANNHVLDWGRSGLVETVQTLRDAEIAAAGAGLTEAAAKSPAEVASGGDGRILIFSWAMPNSGVPPAWAARNDQSGVAFLLDYSDESFAAVADQIEAAGPQVSDIVIASIHWGGNWGYEVSDDQRRFAHRLIEHADVDIVHGHSSHHVKAVEVHRDRLILYGCGDLATDYEGISGHRDFRGDLGLMYFPEVDAVHGRLVSLRMQPTQVRQMQLRRPTAEDAAWLERRLNRECRPFGAHVKQTEDGMFQLHWGDGLSPFL